MMERRESAVRADAPTWFVPEGTQAQNSYEGGKGSTGARGAVFRCGSRHSVSFCLDEREARNACGCSLQCPATEIMENTLCAWSSGIDVRREVLERVAKRFKELNSLSQTTPEEACLILRYAIFENYTNSNPDYSVKTLTTTRGVLVDNTILLSALGAEYEPVNNLKGPTFIYCSACYRKDLGRFSISPAMVVVLLALMLNAFGEKFNDIGAVFEHAVARFVFFAVQVFQGRHVKELVDFITGHFSVVGKTAQKILDSPSVLYDLPNSGLHTNHIISTK